MTEIKTQARKYDYTDVMIWGGILLMIIWIIAKALSLLGYI